MGKDRGINRWELVTCAVQGHVTYAPDDEKLAGRLSGTTGLGTCGDACAAVNSPLASRTAAAAPRTRR